MSLNQNDGQKLPLSGIRVVEIAQNLAGPYTGLILARMGADVVKVERPDGGDDARGWGPPFVAGSGLVFHANNPGKRSITVDLKDPAEVGWLSDYIARADVLVQNLRAGALEELGLGAEALCERNPRLIYCSVTAFGPDGPLWAKPGYEPLVQAFAGLMLVSGTPDSPPFRIGVPALDIGTGMWAALGVLGALIRRATTGQGCVVDASLFDTALAWLGNHVMKYRMSGEVPERHPTGTRLLIPFQAFDTKTGPMMIAAGNDRLFAKLAHAIGKPEWASDPRFRDSAGRQAHQEALLGEIERIMKTRSKGEWIDRLEEAGVPCGPVQTLPEVLAHPQTEASGVLQPLPGLDLDVVGLPLRFDNVRPPTLSPAPELGKHNQEIRGGDVERVASGSR